MLQDSSGEKFWQDFQLWLDRCQLEIIAKHELMFRPWTVVISLPNRIALIIKNMSAIKAFLDANPSSAVHPIIHFNNPSGKIPEITWKDPSVELGLKI